jgi:cytochrome c biogenesis protein CcmG/thiol:disulfide interchange protein DsbE
MKRGIFITLLLATSLVLAAEGISCSSRTSSQIETNNSATPPEIGQQAPNIAVTDLSGKTVNLNDFMGNSVLLNFWAVDCDQCNMERDLFKEVYKEYPDIQIMMVDSKDDIGTIKRFVSSIDFTLPVYVDEQMIAAGTFDVHLIPKTFLIDRTGIIKYIQDGAFADQAQLENALKSLQ